MPKARIFPLKWLLSLLVIGLAWFSAIRILWTDWNIDPQYSYGLLVPFLVIGLLLKRWEIRPVPETLSPVGRVAAEALLLGAAGVLSLDIPMSEANPDWRPLGAIAALSAVIISLSLVAMVGGSIWLKNFAFPICFFLIAVPWTRGLEQAVMDPLMSWNTATTLEILHWSGYEAIRQGNLIAIPSGVLGIEEACSGVRSLQSGLMVALFFGEILRLEWGRRFLLLLVAVLAALVGNVCRSSLLALIASAKGVSAVLAWHDIAGLMVLVISFGMIFVTAWFWKGKSAASMPAVIKIESLVGGKSFSWSVIPAVAVLLSSLVLTECWFVAHEIGVVKGWTWGLHQRLEIPGVKNVPISTSTLRMLFYPSGFSEKWISMNGERGQVFYFEWPAGRTAVQAVTMHNPEACLTSVGMHLTTSLTSVVYEVGGNRIPFNAWLFEAGGESVYVFHALLEQGTLANSKIEEDTPSGRLRSLLTGHRNHGQRMVEVAFWNLPDENSAREALVRYLREALDSSHFQK